MDGVVIAILIVAAIAIAIVAYVAYERRRRQQLHESFGSEYDRAVAESGTRGAASELADRSKRVASFEIRSLSPSAQRMYADRWTRTQARFVDDPKAAIHEADVLVVEVMSERGYPMEEFEQRSADLSVDYPEVVHDYRAAHGISLGSDQGAASTEDQRQAMIYYRSLFAGLLETDGDLSVDPVTVDLNEEQAIRSR